MSTSFESIARLSEQELFDHFTRLVGRDRRTTADLLVAMAEIDQRKLWARQACSSMFSFCMERFHMSEQVTAKRIWAARTAHRFPVMLEMVARGELHLDAIHLLARHLTAQNHVQVLERAKHRSSREIERLVAELAPRADVPSRIRAMPGRRPPIDGSASAERDEVAARERNEPGAGGQPIAADREVLSSRDSRPATGHEIFGKQSDCRPPETVEPRSVNRPVVALSPRRYKIQITVDQSTHDKLRSLQDLLANSTTGRDPAAIVSQAIDVLLVRTLARKAGCTSQPKRARSDSATRAAAMAREQRSRTIPAAVRREVWQRDSGRCCYEDGQGRRCGETSSIEFHHRTPFATGGGHTPQNIELRCAAHNQYQADLDFGRSFMDARRRNLAAV